MVVYAFQDNEKKWQQQWAAHQPFKADDSSKKPLFYTLEFFPYPSGTLHMGHARNYVLGDVMARHRWALGYTVLHPMGWDAFGLPAENAALQRGIHPKEWTYANAAEMKKDCQRLGFSHDWSREIFSCDPSYYRHEQKMFLDFYKKDLVYRKKANVNWDPVECSVLANEQVVDGKGWRSGAVVEKKVLDQWFLRITNFAEDLLQGIEQLTEWPESVRHMQSNWIGRSVGVRIRLPFLPPEEGTLEIFTTRPETFFGASFCAIAPEHPLAEKWAKTNPALKAFLEECAQKGTSSRLIETEEKKGIFSGYSVAHPFIANQTLPVYVANYVLINFSTGAIYGCPAHDQRDFEFAQKYGLPILPVVQPVHGNSSPHTQAYLGDGILMHSEFLDGLTVEEARVRVVDRFVQKGVGEKEIVYRLNDWGISRQRYWGAPIPIIHCPICGIIPVPEKDLPVTLPEDVTFDKPGNPLERHPTWKYTRCPSCEGDATRETDTLDTFFESSWYFARFCDPHNEQEAFSEEKTQKWMPVDQYIGGIEHAVMHLLYARFFSRALSVCGYWNVHEPFKKLLTQGMVCHKSFRSAEGKWLYPEEVDYHSDGQCFQKSDGSPVTVGRSEKMSKSKCNVVSVQSMVKRYGADPVRLFLLSDTPPDKDLEWTESGIEGAVRYVTRLWEMVAKKIPLARLESAPPPNDEGLSPQGVELRYITHQTVASVNRALERYHLNKYIAHLREFSNALEVFVPKTLEDIGALRESLEFFVRLAALALPHTAEALWEQLGHAPFVHQAPWPVYDPSLLELEEVVMAIQVNGKTKGTLGIPVHASKEAISEMAQNHPSVQKALQGHSLKQVIIIPNRVINLVLQ